MGSFSWYASDTKRAIRSENPFPVYALRPNAEPLLELDYGGYGKFGGQDIHELVADWNREYLSKHPDFEIPQRRKIWDETRKSHVFVDTTPVREFYWYPLYADLTQSRKDIEKELKKMMPYWDYREIGIDIAGDDKRNSILPYPIKLVETPVPYPAAAASKSDPGQGWGENDRFEGDDPDTWQYKNTDEEEWI